METPPAGVYEPRNPRATSFYALVEDYYQEFERVCDDRYQQQYGPWRPVIGEVMRKYLDCGGLHRGFARLGCGGTLRIIGSVDNPAVIEKILRHLKLRARPERPPPPRCSRRLEPDADLLAWEATGRLFDGID